ncbi:HAD family hydrolase [Streptococcus merionis]|uniref:HAD family hydrolase n=1 Tax=Streptococcus merionis TaxID=400065 RepID=UPI0026EC3800|nr:HAD family hydrolase [Streptococcus merionis]
MDKAIFFDIDDTLYDQLIPFQKAFEKNFNYDDIDVAELYKLSRELSDSVFELSESGKLSMREMQIFRIKEALKRLGHYISDDVAMIFQEDYSDFQKECSLPSLLSELFYWLIENDIKVGIITNGPSEHQRQKIQQLHLEKWISDKYIFISSELNTAKPDSRIFDIAREKISPKLLPKNCYYVGDSYANDVVGAKKASWNTIWYSRRCSIIPNSIFKSDYIVKNDSELYQIIIKLFHSD